MMIWNGMGNPGICTIHGAGERATIRFLIMLNILIDKGIIEQWNLSLTTIILHLDWRSVTKGGR